MITPPILIVISDEPADPALAERLADARAARQRLRSAERFRRAIVELLEAREDAFDDDPEMAVFSEARLVLALFPARSAADA